MRHATPLEVRAHADNVHWVEENQTWVKNGAGHRTWSSTTLLNDPSEYTGGTFRFHEPVRQDMTIGRPPTRATSPRSHPRDTPLGKGEIVVFESSEKNVHSVDTIPSGDRYTLLVWLTHEHADHRTPKASASIPFGWHTFRV
jgi:predicted 2-oxoglutarate/Fe(II)-dependent dioxygenase YbiX